MSKSTLHSLIIGFSPKQHIALAKDLKLAHALLRLNDTALKPDAFELLIQRTSIDVVFLKYNSSANFLPLYKKLRANNQDCIVIELIDPSLTALDDPASQQLGIQKCLLQHNSNSHEFNLTLQFVMQYVVLKKDFRRCKSLLFLSESRALRLVDSSNHAIAFIAKGKFIHANIPFLVMFSAESIGELKRFSLRRLISEDDYDVFAKYVASINYSAKIDTDLLLTMRRTSGAPFNAKIQMTQVVSNGQRCHQIWIEQRTQAYEEEKIPVTKALNVWDMPLAQVDTREVNPFDRILGKNAQVKGTTTASLDVLQRELLNDRLVKLRFRELYDPKSLSLNSAWAKLDVDPENFRMINSLLSRNATSASRLYSSFWDQLMFKLVLEMIDAEVLSERQYLVTLSASTINDSSMMMLLYKQLKTLGDKTKQLILVIDAETALNKIPQMLRVAALLKSAGCRIALNNFSVSTTPLFLFKNIKPYQVIIDTQWIDELKAKKDNGLFIERFVQHLKGHDVSVLIPHAIQKHQDRLFVLTGASIGQEIPTQDCA